MLYAVKNKNLFIMNSENHTKNTRQSNNFHQPITTLTMYQGWSVLHGHQGFQYLPSFFKEASNNVMKFETNLK
jgi:hypothetical protein